MKNAFDFATLQQLYHSAQDCIRQQRLKEACSIIRALLHESQEESSHQQLQVLQTNYESILRYYGQGIQDPQLSEVLTDLSDKIFTLLDTAHREVRLRLADPLDDYAHDYFESVGYRPYNWTKIQMDEEVDPYVRLIARFKELHTTQLLSQDVQQAASQLITERPCHEACALLSALTVGLLAYYDRDKLRILAEHCNHPHPLCRARAVAGVGMALRHHCERIAYDRKTADSLVPLLLQHGFDNQLYAFLHQHTMAQLCEETERQLEEEIVPSIIRASKDEALQDEFRQIAEATMDPEEDDLERLIHQSAGTSIQHNKSFKKIEKNITRIIDMYREGFDGNLGSLRSSFHKSAFFNEPFNWLAVFDDMRPEVYPMTHDENGTLQEIPNIMLNRGGYCETDKYAMLLVNTKIWQKMVETGEQLSQMNGTTAGLLQQDPLEGERPLNSYIQSLYRYYRIARWSRWAGDTYFRAPSDWLHNRWIVALLDNMVNGDEVCNQISEWLDNHQLYAEALPYLQRLEQRQGSTRQMLLRQAYCYLQNEQYTEAVNLLLKADILDTLTGDELWQLQLCYGKLGRKQKQLECLLTLESEQPDQPRVTIEAGLCLMHLERYQEAAQRFYKLELEGRHQLSSMRAIAWCSLRLGKISQALKYYDRIINELHQATWQDYLNMGHAYWADSNNAQALECYRQYVKRYHDAYPKANNLLEPFCNDRGELLRLGKQEHEINLMADLI